MAACEGVTHSGCTDCIGYTFADELRDALLSPPIDGLGASPSSCEKASFSHDADTEEQG